MGKVKGPGKAASKRGAVMARGRATQVMTYPRPKTKSVLVTAAKAAGAKLSTYMIVAALEKRARTLGVDLVDLVPADEFLELTKHIGGGQATASVPPA